MYLPTPLSKDNPPVPSGRTRRPSHVGREASTRSRLDSPRHRPHSISRGWARLVSSVLDANGVKKPAQATMLSMGAAGFESAGCDRPEETSPGDPAPHRHGWARTSD